MNINLPKSNQKVYESIKLEDSKRAEMYVRYFEKYKGKRWNDDRANEISNIIDPGSGFVEKVTCNSKPFKWVCSSGHVSVKTPYGLEQGHGCNQCSINRRTPNVKEIEKKVQEKGVTLVKFAGMTNSPESIFECRYGNRFKGSARQVVRGERKCQCHNCREERKAKKERWTKEMYIKHLDKVKNIHLPLENWKGPQAKTKMHCRECGNWITTRPYDLCRGGIGCKYCSGHGVITNIVRDYFRENGYKIHADWAYVNVYEKIPCTCPSGHPWDVSWIAFRHAGARCATCFRERISGEDSNFYNPELTDEEREQLYRMSSEMLKAIRNAKIRDGWRCCICEINQRESIEKNAPEKYKGTEHENTFGLHGHHIFGASEYKKLRTIIDNIITLCHRCHIDGFHAEYGHGENVTGEKLLEWLNKQNIQKGKYEIIKARIETLTEFSMSDYEDYDKFLKSFKRDVS